MMDETRWRWWHFLPSLVVMVAGLMLAPHLAKLLYHPPAGQSPDETANVIGAWANALQFVLYVALGILATAPLLRGFDRTSYGLLLQQKFRIAIATACGFVLFIFLSYLFENYAPNAQEASKEVAASLEFGTNRARDIAMILAITTCAPLGEEFLFRGLMFRPLYDGLARLHWLAPVRHWLPFIVATAVSAQMFRDSHGGGGQEVQMVMFFIMGVINCAAYAWTGSLFAPVMIHSLNNSLVLGNLLKDFGWTERAVVYAMPLFCFAVLWLLMKALPARKIEYLK